MAETRYSAILVSQDETGASIVGSISASDINAVYDEMASEHRRLLEKTGLALPDDTGDSVQLKLEVEACHKRLCFKKIRDIAVPEQCLIAILRRAGRAVIPRGDTTVEPGDTLIMLTVREREQALRDWIHEVGRCQD